jgi:hypothetical protein
MAENKTKPTGESVANFLNNITDESRRQDCFALLEFMRKTTATEPKLWGSSIVGFGDYHYKYASGREGDSAVVGFSPRKQNLTIYLLCNLESQEELLGQLGKSKHGKACLYVNRLDDINLPVLRELIQLSFENVRQKYS